jgi:acetate kinase
VKILVLNSGSSSVKYRLYADEQTVDKGVVERVTDHDAALAEVTERLDLSDLDGVGHRVVHGGLRFSEPALVTDEVVAAVRELIPLAPLHNPANLAGIEVARRRLPGVPQVAVFDTAFHRTLPEEAATYAIDAELAREHGVHRYGFHGTSHAYVSRRVAALLGRPLETVNTITLHLGNGASVCAVEGGRSVATSMGLTPLQGLVMGTRSGDIDPGVLIYLARNAGMGVDDLDDLLNHRSGLQGLAGAGDMREVLSRRAAGDRPPRSRSPCTAGGSRSMWAGTTRCSAASTRSRSPPGWASGRRRYVPSRWRACHGWVSRWTRSATSGSKKASSRRTVRRSRCSWCRPTKSWRSLRRRAA